MPTYDCDRVFNDKVITDTADHISDVSDHRVYQPKTIAVVNGHNQQGTFQVQGSPLKDFNDVFDIGPTFNVPANSNDYETTDAYFPFLRLKVSYSTAPTTGNLNTYFQKVES